VYNKWRFFDFSTLPFEGVSHEFTQYDSTFSVSAFNFYRTQCGEACEWLTPDIDDKPDYQDNSELLLM